MRAYPHTPERDAVLERALPAIPDQGWNWQAIRSTAPVDATVNCLLPQELFPGGGPDMIEAFFDLADRRMMGGAAFLPAELRPSQRLRASLALRLKQTQQHRAAIARATAIMALTGQIGLAARTTYRTVDALWSASLDTAVDVSWYTKRATLALVYQATLLFWLQDEDPSSEPTLAFFDRRVAGLRRVGRLASRLSGR